MLASIHKFFSQNVINIPINIPLSMAIGYYIDGTKGMTALATLSLGDLALKHSGFDSYYLSFASIGVLTGKKVAANLITHYKYLKAAETCKEDITIADKIDILDHLLPVSLSAVGLIGAYAMNKIEHAVVDYIYDNNESTCLIFNENDVAEVLEVG